MRKKDLITALARAEARIEVLELIICPAYKHTWFYDYVEGMRICTKCGKVVFMDEPFPNP